MVVADAITWPEPRPNTCGDDGPWGTRCTQDPGHRYAHYDASDDSSWTDDVMRGWVEDHPEAILPADTLYRPRSPVTIVDHEYEPWEGEVGDPPTCDRCGFAEECHGPSSQDAGGRSE